MSDFTPPTIRPMETIMLSAFADFHDPMPALVLEVNARSVNCLTFGGRMMMYRNCWHKDDPKCKSHDENINEDSERGCWDYSQATREMRLLTQTVRDLQRELREAKRWITAAEGRRSKGRRKETAVAN